MNDLLVGAIRIKIKKLFARGNRRERWEERKETRMRRRRRPSG